MPHRFCSFSPGRLHHLVAVLGLLPMGGGASSTENPAQPLQPWIDQGELAGGVTAIVTTDQVLALGASGYADLVNRRPMTEDAVFWIASISKPVAGTALMMLVEEGKVNLDDPVEKYLPEFKGQMVIKEQTAAHTLLGPPVHPITVREILTHTSGLPFRTAIEYPTIDQLPLRLAVLSYASQPLLFEPGTEYRYSNAGINTVGRIIEVVSGYSYEDFLQTRLFTPLGMSDTTFWPDAAQLNRLAHPYKRTAPGGELVADPIDQLYYPLPDRQRRYAVPAGGLFSTASDLARFCQMILNDGELDGRRYLAADSVLEMIRSQTGLPANDYGLGWGVGKTSYGHVGAYGCEMHFVAGRPLAFIFLIQQGGDNTAAAKARGDCFRHARERYGNY